MKIVLLEPLAIHQKKLKELSSKLIAMGHEFVAYDTVETDENLLKERVKEADILIIANHPLSGEVIRYAQNLKYISIAFTGYDHVDLEACEEKNIHVSNAQGYATEAVAELTIAMIISLLRNVIVCNEVVRKGGTKEGFVGKELFGKTVGIIGTGAIGLRTAQLLKVFGCKLLGFSRSESLRAKELGIEYVGLEELLSNSDIVSLHLPLNKKTQGLLSKEKIALMKKDALLINTARGAIVDNQALAEALNKGQIAGAGIDVFETEPPFSDHPLFHAPNTLLTPHVAFATEESMIKRANIVFDNVYSWIQGEQKNKVI
ncbi:2-hydroxyacid dehydrogenase [Garciella nitratireducens]|uniref:D-3-phosphoglycerate dehydrogenase n=1 Tax=Garciella nitratireducens DSM 15102 TaxID=1121911 RepID=A0A1T4KMH2_9FIRM|nr:2-hydroxyacid dehydrogenase [Garciella nitratireducens]SJZ43642.1 D-3-phosphoglycerate dehydrogenase [Garciella nitratireducens DSM 15102]